MHKPCCFQAAQINSSCSTSGAVPSSGCAGHCIPAEEAVCSGDMHKRQGTYVWSWYHDVDAGCVFL
jgi:predicted Fe-S protein YdhL (DUF1289 family)